MQGELRLRFRRGERRPHLVSDGSEEDVLHFALRSLPADLLAAHPEVAEDPHLGPDDLRIDRLEQVVHGAVRVPLEHVRRLAAQRGDEDDRHVTGLLALLDQLGGLQPVELRHLHVEEDDRERLPEQVQQGFFAGPRLHDARAERLEDRFQREEVLGAVVDDQHAANWRLSLCGHLFSKVSSPEAACGDSHGR